MIQKPKGTRDFIADDASSRERITSSFIEFAQNMGYLPVQPPIFERSELFERAVGQTSDIVQKELFYISQNKDEKFALRPELTAGVVRALIENGIKSMPKPVNVYTIGSVYRYEKPQKGRYREFTQFDLNSFGEQSAFADAYFIANVYTFLSSVIGSDVKIYLNTLGSPETKQKFSKELVGAIGENTDKLCSDCKSRVVSNPLRVLDCKANCKANIENAPQISDYLSDDEKEYFAKITEFLKNNDVNFEVDTNLMRGLDYYTSIVFEITMPEDNSRSSVLAGGGRFDNLVESLSGPVIGAIGVGLGLDRIVENAKEKSVGQKCEYMICPISSEFDESAYTIALQLNLKGKSALVSTSYNLKSSLSDAVKSNCRYAVIVGDESKDKKIILKDLKKNSQQEVRIQEIA